jgi:hypothetical protein
METVATIELRDMGPTETMEILELSRKNMEHVETLETLEIRTDEPG